MVTSFQLARIPKINFKCGAIGELPGIARSFGSKILLVTGSSSFIISPYAEKLFNEFGKAGITYNVFTIPGEPSPEIIDEAVRKYINEDFNLVIGIGGGSVLDAGKAISAMMYKTESVTEFLEGVGTKNHPGTKLPFIAVPTTSGTGSEATKNAVISKIGENGFKKSLRHDNFVPDIALVDPELTLHCPVNITAASGMDCFTQLTEAYLSDKSNDITDAIALGGLRSISSSLICSYENGEDIEARSGMSLAALTSGICIANAGLGVVHGFASSIGGMYNIPHGVVCGTLMAEANKVNIIQLRKKQTNPAALKKYAVLGELFLNVKGKTDEYYIDGFIEYLQKLTNLFDLPGLKEYGFEEKNIELICSKAELKNNPVILSVDDLIEIVQNRL